MGNNKTFQLKISAAANETICLYGQVDANGHLQLTKINPAYVEFLENPITNETAAKSDNNEETAQERVTNKAFAKTPVKPNKTHTEQTVTMSFSSDIMYSWVFWAIIGLLALSFLNSLAKKAAGNS